MTIQKGVNPLSYSAGGTISQYEPVKMGTTDNTVIRVSATSDIPIGVAQLDADSNKNVPVETRPGAVVKMRVGSGGVSGGNSVGIDSTDKTEIAALTLDYSGTTRTFRYGIVDAASGTSFAENELAPIRLTLDNVLT